MSLIENTSIEVLSRRIAELEKAAADHRGTIAAFRENERMFRLITENATDMISRHSEAGEYLYASPSFQKMLGYRPEELVGCNAYDFFHPEDVQRIRLSHRTVLELSGDYTVAYRIRKKDGSYRWVETISKRIENHAHDQPPEIIAITRDITDRKKTETALQNSRDELLLRNRIAGALLTTEGAGMYAEVLTIILDELNSRYGYFGYIDDAGDLVCPSMTYDIWDQCGVHEKNIVFPKEKWSGLWGRSLREQRTLFANHPLNVPKGHLPLQRALVCPILQNEKLVGQVAVANKTEDYDERDRNRIEGITAIIAPFLIQRLAKEKEETARRQMESALRASETGLRTLSAQLIHTQEKERRRISIELHDELGQALMVLKLQLRAIQHKAESSQPELASSVAESLRYIDNITDRVRRLSRELNPALLDDLGLGAAVRQLAAEAMQHADLRIKTELQDTRGLLSRDMEISLFRVFQEALTNVLKHADASRILLEMRVREDRVTCRVEDNGQGFAAENTTDVTPAGIKLGLTAMAERMRMAGGDWVVRSQPGAGTCVEFSVPRPPVVPCPSGDKT